MLGLINCFTRGEQELPRIIFNIIGYVLSDILFWLATLTSIQTYQLRFLSACSETDSLSVLIYFEFSQRSQKLLLTPTALTLRFEFTLSGFPKNVCVSGEKTRKIRSEKLRKMRISLTRFHCGTLGEHFFCYENNERNNTKGRAIHFQSCFCFAPFQINFLFLPGKKKEYLRKYISFC